MTRRLLGIIVVALACAKSAPPPVAHDRDADERAIRATLDDWYAAMYANDSTRIVAPLTSQFLLLEDTLPLSGTQLVTRLKSDSSGTKWKANFSDLKTRIEGDVAWTTLRNHEDIHTRDGKTLCADFLETIVFVRAGERWKIDRYHAADMHTKACTA